MDHLLTHEQVRENRQILQAFLGKVTEAQINLNWMLAHPHYGSVLDIISAGVPCRTVGCLGGWGILCPEYQAWATRHNFHFYEFDILEYWLGLSNNTPGYFSPADPKGGSHYAQFQQRIIAIQKEKISFNPDILSAYCSKD